MSETEFTIQARDSKFDQSGKEGSIQSASNESSAGDTDVYGVIQRAVAEQLGEYFTLTLTNDSEAVQATNTGDTKRFGKYETAGRQVYGLGVSKEILEEVFGEEVPENIGLKLAPSSEEEFESALEGFDGTAEEEADALIVGGDSDDSEEEVSEESEAENLVEISDEELGLAEN